MDNIFGIMVDGMNKRTITTYDGLVRALREEWAALTVEKVQSLYGSWERRLNAIIEAKGGHTKY
jgi:hypothetical protein